MKIIGVTICPYVCVHTYVCVLFEITEQIAYHHTFEKAFFVNMTALLAETIILHYNHFVCFDAMFFSQLLIERMFVY